MATYSASPGPFKARDAEPEATLELLDEYLETMEMVFRLSRRMNPVTGAKVDFDDKEKKDMLRVEGGEDMKELFRHVGKVVEDDTYLQAVTKIKAALKQRGNRTSAVFRLFQKHPQGGQTFDSWHREIFKAATLIDWTGYNAETAAADAIIMQTSSLKLQQRAIQENPTYGELVSLGISQEQARRKATSLPDGEGETVHRLRQENVKLKNQLGKQKTPQRTANKQKTAGTGSGRGVTCKRCGNPNCQGGSGCRAIGKECYGCKEKGHFGTVCPRRKGVRRIEQAEQTGSESEAELLMNIKCTVVGRVDSEKDSIYTELQAGGGTEEDRYCANIKLATDTGVRKTILNRSDWRKIEDECSMVKTKISFRPYGTDIHLPVRGRAKVKLKARAGASITTWVYVNDTDKETSLLGKRDAQRLGIIRIKLDGENEEVNPEGAEEEADCRRIRAARKAELSGNQKIPEKNKQQVEEAMDKIADEFRDIFQGIGKYKGAPVKIQLTENVIPVIQPARRIPLHYIKPLEDHLEEMLEQDVIEGPLEEEEEGTWISNLVITDKRWDGAQGTEGQRTHIRANLDCRPLNKYVYQTHEPIPTPDELRHKLRGSNKFSALDLTHSFHQFVLEKKARKLFTFRTPKGLMRYKRLTMGNSPASSEAHKRIKTVLQGCDGVVQIKDDIVVHGRGEEHDQRLRIALEKLQAAGLTLRREKCFLGKSEIKWFGMVFTEEGMATDPEKVAVIKNWPPPRTVSEVKSFLQTVQFNAIYMAAEEPGEMQYAELTAPLRNLTHNGVKFTWTAEHQHHFDLMKERMCGDRVMVPYDPARKTRIYSDGGPEGCQATVAQAYQHETKGEQWRPVAHTARAWTPAEKRYSQIEKESNAMHSGIISNKTYLLGTEFEAVVDHKPLLTLFNSPGRPKQMRVDRHRMKLAAYNFTVVHMAGTQIPCDYGSRRGCPEAKKYNESEKDQYGVEEDDEIYVNRLVDEQLPTAITRNMLREATARDPKMKMLMEDLEIGVCRKALTGFTGVFGELEQVDGLVVRSGSQLVIPTELQALAVAIAHEGHVLGHEKTLGLLRETCWFPGMAQMVKEYVETCLPCLAAVPGTGQEPLKPTELPDRPWQHVHADYKGPIGGRYYLHTIIDQYSKYPVVGICTSTSWDQMEPMLETALGQYGNVESITTDNGPPYNSHNFASFAKKMGFKHRTCTPENPAANGFVEVFQKVLVKLVHTAVIEKKDPRRVLEGYLRQYRAAPHKTTGRSPFELLFNRKMMTKLPYQEGRQPGNTDAAVRTKHAEEKEKQKKYSDRRRRVKDKVIRPGDSVLIQRKKTTLRTPWDPEPFRVIKVEGSRVTGRRGQEEKARAKNRLKVVKPRPRTWETPRTSGRRRRGEEELDLEVSLAALGPAVEPEQQEQQALPDLPEDEEDWDDDEEANRPINREAAALRDALSRAYEPARLKRATTAPRRIGFEEERTDQRDQQLRTPEEGSESRASTPGATASNSRNQSPDSSLATEETIGMAKQDYQTERLEIGPGPLDLAAIEVANPTWGGTDEPELMMFQLAQPDEVFEAAMTARQQKRREANSESIKKLREHEKQSKKWQAANRRRESI
jgi:transposase InsO family protein